MLGARSDSSDPDTMHLGGWRLARHMEDGAKRPRLQEDTLLGPSIPVKRQIGRGGERLALLNLW